MHRDPGRKGRLACGRNGSEEAGRVAWPLGEQQRVGTPVLVVACEAAAVAGPNRLFIGDAEVGSPQALRAAFSASAERPLAAKASVSRAQPLPVFGLSFAKKVMIELAFSPGRIARSAQPRSFDSSGQSR